MEVEPVIPVIIAVILAAAAIEESTKVVVLAEFVSHTIVSKILVELAYGANWVDSKNISDEVPLSV